METYIRNPQENQVEVITEQRRSASLNPADAVDDSLDLEVMLLGDWEPISELINIQICNCHKLVPRLVKSIAHRRDTTMTTVAAYCMVVGIRELWSRFGRQIVIIRGARAFVNLSGGDWDDRDFFDSKERVDLGTSNLEDFSVRIHTSTVARCDGLASDIGFKPHNIRQLAIMAGIIHCPLISREDQLVMIGIIKKFGKQIAKRARKAEEIRARTALKLSHNPEIAPNEDPWEEIMED
jgi:hypothetical protein